MNKIIRYLYSCTVEKIKYISKHWKLKVKLFIFSTWLKPKYLFLKTKKCPTSIHLWILLGKLEEQQGNKYFIVFILTFGFYSWINFEMKVKRYFLKPLLFWSWINCYIEKYKNVLKNYNFNCLSKSHHLKFDTANAHWWS